MAGFGICLVYEKAHSQGQDRAEGTYNTELDYPSILRLGEMKFWGFSRQANTRHRSEKHCPGLIRRNLERLNVEDLGLYWRSYVKYGHRSQRASSIWLI